jgi:hypothetical protein
MHKYSRILIAWALLVQGVALVQDNPQLLKDSYEYWAEAARFASQDLCTTEAERRQAEDKKTFKIYGDKNGIILSWRYRCLEVD